MPQDLVRPPPCWPHGALRTRTHRASTLLEDHEPRDPTGGGRTAGLAEEGWPGKGPRAPLPSLGSSAPRPQSCLVSPFAGTAC